MLSSLQNMLFLAAQYLLPHHLLSRLTAKLADCEWIWLKNLLISSFISAYDVNMQEAQFSDVQDYKSFNAFFTRALKQDARPIAQSDDNIISPVDGRISQIGRIENDRIFQAKNHDYSLTELLAGADQLAAHFVDGTFATIYLSPKDYHRVHMPVAGTLKEMHYVPGRLFSVSPFTTEKIPGLFARNERMIAYFETEIGPMAVIMVGAMIVAGIETVWAEQVAPTRDEISISHYDQGVKLNQGDEMGRFKLGSTVILLFGKDAAKWQSQLATDQTLKLGELIGSHTTRPATLSSSVEGER